MDDSRERAAREHELRNEDVIFSILATGSPSQLEELRAVHGLTEKKIEWFRHYARMRYDTLAAMREERERRLRDNPEPTDEERKAGCFAEDIEPQVRDAVFALRKKGYETIASGFQGVGETQHVLFQNQIAPDIIPDALVQSLKERGTNLRVSQNMHAIEFSSEGELGPETIRSTWKQITDTMPDLGQPAAESTLPVAAAFRKRHAGDARVPTAAWNEPVLETERGELERTSENLHIPLEKLIEAFRVGSLQELTDDQWDALQNADSRDASWNLDEVVAYRETDDRAEKRDVRRIVEGMERGDTIPAPVVLFRTGHPPYLVAGNTRLLVARATKKRPAIFAIST